MLITHEIATPFSSIGLFRQFKDEPNFFFLDSGTDPQKLGRYSFMGFDPFLTFRSKEGSLEIEENGHKTRLNDNPFRILQQLLNRYKIESDDIPIPFTGGAVGYFSYDLLHHLERISSNTIDDLNLSDLNLSFYDATITFDHLKDKTYVISTGFPELDQKKRLMRARKRSQYIKERISQAAIAPKESIDADIFCKETISNFNKDDYMDAIKKAKEYIARGDIYQVNLSQRFSSRIDLTPGLLYERLRSINPAPFAAYLDCEDVKIISASPERFLCKRGRNIHTRPIKGTRPRGIDCVQDKELAEELIKSPKDRAEHIMIVDLQRNDLGRICEYGSVMPTEFAILERYSTVFHLVSTVSGTLRKGIDAIDCLTHTFPGGSITGAPKIRSMEIIDELEPTKRSVYTGAIGYIGFNGNMDTSIVIRTFIVKERTAYFQVGGGIVTDSDPEMEYQETLDKAKALIDSLGCSTISRSSVAL